MACIALCESISYWLYPLAFIIVGTRQHGLEAMMHEATHYRLHPNRKVNDFIGELSVWPLGLSVYLYRNLRHFRHHKFIGTLKDPHISQSYKRNKDRYLIPATSAQLVKNCVVAALMFPVEVWLGPMYVTGKLLRMLSKQKAWLWIGFQLGMASFIVAGTLVWGWIVVKVYVLYFVLPQMWVAVFSRYLRLLAEHFGIPGGTETAVAGASTRTVLVCWPLRVMLWPHNLNYHLEHHWYPSVPFYNLPGLHKMLYRLPHVRKRMHVTKGLRALWEELTRSKKSLAA